jgi:Zn-dependent protease with chaperone function
MLRHVNQADLFVSVLGLVWAVLACVTLILTIGGMRSYIAWLKMWMLVRQKPTATPWPPSVYPYVRQSARVGLCAAIMAIGVANVLHLVFTVDILSVLLVDQYAISRVIGLSLGWILIDLEAAAEGIPEKSPLGIGVLLALALPTLLVFLGWTFTALDRVLRCRRRTHRIPVEPRLQELVGRLASQMAVRTPVVQVTDRDEPRVETMVSWLSLKATLMISQGALEVLDERELEAAVAHELAHVKYDTRVVLATRWLSALSLFPCNAFAIVLDTEQRELRADRTAASVVASSDAVQKAIAKTSVGSMFVTTRRGGRQTHRTPTKNQHGREAFTQRLGRYAELISAVTHPEFLPDYAHPTLPERLSALRIDSSQKPYD